MSDQHPAPESPELQPGEDANTNEEPGTDAEFTEKYTQPDKPDAAATAQQHFENVANQFMPGKNQAPKGVSEAGSVKGDIKASGADAVRIGVDVAGLALTISTAGAGAAVATPAGAAAATAAASAATAASAGTAAAVDGAASATASAAAAKLAAETTKASIADVAGGAASKVGTELGKDAGQKLAGEAAETAATSAAESATKDGLKGAAKEGATKQSISDLIGDASKTDGPNGGSMKSRIQDSIDRINNDGSVQQRAKDDLKKTAKKPDTWRRSEGNSDTAREKNNVAWEDDHRGGLEKSLDKGKEATGVDGLKAVGKVPLVGGILEGGANIAMRAERHIVKKNKQNISAIAGLAGATIFVLFVSLMMGATSGSNGSASTAMNATACNTDGAGSTAPIGGSFALTSAQVGIAKTIIGVAKGIFLSGSGGDATARDAALIGVETGLVESGLGNPPGGDLDSVGTFQQRATWGTAAQRQNPVYSSTKFYVALQAVPGWTTMDSGAAAALVQRPAAQYAGRYTLREADAGSVIAILYDTSPSIAPDPAAGGAPVTQLGAGASAGTSVPAACSGNITVSANKQVLAQQLLGMIAAKTLTVAAAHLPQITIAAAGATTANCNVDAMIMQAIVIAVKTDPPIAVSSINRLCTGENVTGLGAGVFSAHYAQGGGHAVDFNFIGGNRADAQRGRDPDSLKVIAALYNYFPQKGFALGQIECNPGHAPISVGSWVQFGDTCSHLHFQDYAAAGRN